MDRGLIEQLAVYESMGVRSPQLAGADAVLLNDPMPDQAGHRAASGHPDHAPEGLSLRDP